jgi:hypothetical protein
MTAEVSLHISENKTKTNHENPSITGHTDEWTDRYSVPYIFLQFLSDVNKA